MESINHRQADRWPCWVEFGACVVYLSKSSTIYFTSIITSLFASLVANSDPVTGLMGNTWRSMCTDKIGLYFIGMSNKPILNLIDKWLTAILIGKELELESGESQ